MMGISIIGPAGCAALLVATLALGAATVAQDGSPEPWAQLPEPVTNNAVAGAEIDGRMMAYSFAGLHEGKTWQDITADAYACDLDARSCHEISGIPDGIGRLASVAVNVGGQIYIVGGYTVAEDGSEASTPEVWRFDPASETYTLITNMPVPVDDTVALVHLDRYIYLVSGWHDTDNVDLVQVYDVHENVWFEATPFPGAPVFGHAGAIDRNGIMLICGGTAVIPPVEPGGRRSFEAVADCFAGRINPGGTTEISWQPRGATPEGASYRSALIPIGNEEYYLLGGSDNAYNYNGIGYNGAPSEPRPFYAMLNRCGQRSWTNRHGLPARHMDIRGAIQLGGATYILGGMTAAQHVSGDVARYTETEMSLVTAECAVARPE